MSPFDQRGLQFAACFIGLEEARGITDSSSGIDGFKRFDHVDRQVAIDPDKCGIGATG